MNTSLSWIKAYVPDLNVTEQEYTDAMTLSGTKVEGYEKMDAFPVLELMLRHQRIKDVS